MVSEGYVLVGQLMIFQVSVGWYNYNVCVNVYTEQ